MAHVPLHDHPKGLVPRLAARYTKRRFGQMVEPTAAASHHAGVLVAMGSLETAVQFGWKKLDPTLRWLAVQAAGTRIGCSWCIDYGYYEGMHRGVDPAKVRAVGDWRDQRPLRRARACGPRVRRGGDGLPGRGLRGAGRPDPRPPERRGVRRARRLGGAGELPVALQRRARSAQPGLLGPLRDTRCDAVRARTPLPDAEADAAAFEEWRSLLFGIAYRMLGSAADAEDVVQDASIRWLRPGRRAGPVGPRLSRHDRHPPLPRPARLGPVQTRHLRGPVAARAGGGRRDGGGRAGGLVVARLPRAARGAHAARARRLPAPRRLRLHLRRGGPVAGAVSGRLPATRRAGPQARRGASPALRCRPAPRSRADRPVPRGLRDGGPVGSPLDAVRRRRGLDRRRRQGPRRHAARWSGRTAARGSW